MDAKQKHKRIQTILSFIAWLRTDVQLKLLFLEQIEPGGKTIMIVNQTSNRKMIRNNRGLIFLVLVCWLIVSVNGTEDHLMLFIFNLVTAMAYILLTRYLIDLLQFHQEPITVQTPFSIFLGLQIVIFIGQFFAYGNLGLGIMDAIMVFYILFAAFKVKSKVLSKPMILFGFSLLLRLILGVGILLAATKMGRTFPVQISGLAQVIPLFTILYILSQNSKYLKLLQMEHQ